MSKKENNMWYPPYPMPYPMGGNNEDPLLTFQRYRDYFDKMAKDAEEKKKSEKKKPEARKFTFLETFGMCIFFGPILGFGYLYMVKAALMQVELWFK